MIFFLFILLIVFFLGLLVFKFYRLKKTPSLFLVFALLSFVLFSFLSYFPFNYFYAFLLENKKKLLKINSLTLLDDSFDYLEVGSNLKNQIVAFYFDEEKEEFYYKNLGEDKTFLLDDQPTTFFAKSTPFIDLPLAKNAIKVEPVFLKDEENNISTKLNFNKATQKKTIPEKENFHSYTITPAGVIYASPDASNNNLLKIFYDTFEENQKVASEVVGNNYYPYYWPEKEVLFFINLKRVTAEGQSTFLYTLMQYDLKENKVLETTILGGEEKISWRAVKVLGESQGEYVAYNALNRENKLYFFHYDSDDPSKKTHFFLSFQDLDELYSFAFLETEEESVKMVLLGKKNNQNKKSLFLASLDKTEVATINLDGIFYVQLALGIISLVFLWLSFYWLKKKKSN